MEALKIEVGKIKRIYYWTRTREELKNRGWKIKVNLKIGKGQGGGSQDRG